MNAPPSSVPAVAPTPGLTPAALAQGAVPYDGRTARDHLDRILTIVRRTWRFRWYGALVLLTGATLSLALALIRERQYTSETLIVYREGIGTRTISGSDQAVDGQQKLSLRLRELVLSRTRLEKIINEYHLYPDIMDKRGPVDAVDEMRKHIAFRAKDGETFGLSFTGSDPKHTQELTARLARELLDEHSKSRLEQAGETREFLDEEKRRSDEDLREKETMLAGFIAKHPEFAKESNGANAGTQAGIAVRAMGAKASAPRTADPQLNALEREAARIQERLGVPTKRKADKDIDPKLAAARADAESDVKQAQRDLADKLGQFTEEHPDVRAAKTRLKAVEAKLRRANEMIAASDAEAKQRPDVPEEGTIDRAALEAELRKVQDEIAVYKRRRTAAGDAAAPAAASAASASIVSIETDWTRLNREVMDARERNQQLESRQFKASILESAVTSGRNAQMIIVDPAYKPTHPNKGRTQVVGAGLAVSFVFALLVALLCTLLDDRIYDRVDLEAMRLLPLLGVIPRPDGKRDNRG